MWHEGNRDSVIALLSLHSINNIVILRPVLQYIWTVSNFYIKESTTTRCTNKNFCFGCSLLSLINEKEIEWRCWLSTGRQRDSIAVSIFYPPSRHVIARKRIRKICSSILPDRSRLRSQNIRKPSSRVTYFAVSQPRGSPNRNSSQTRLAATSGSSSRVPVSFPLATLSTSCLLTPIEAKFAGGQTQQERHQCQPNAAPTKEHPLTVVVVVVAVGRPLTAWHARIRFIVPLFASPYARRRSRHFIQGGWRACAVGAGFALNQ